MSGVFEKLKDKAHEIDKRIEKLEEIWKTPEGVLYKRGENVEEARQVLADFRAPITKLRDEIKDDLEIINEDAKEMDRFLAECETAADELREGISNIEEVYSEFGYVPPGLNGNGTCLNGSHEKNNDDLENTITDIEKIKNLNINSSNDTDEYGSP